MLRRKVLIIGLDGATWRVLKPMVEENSLPNLQRIVRCGVSGVLESTFPPVTAPAWVSFMTGVYPGKHGVFDFRLPLDQDSQRRPVHSRMISSSTIWQLLGNHGRRVGVVSVPVTYPPSPVNGFVVSGMLSPRFGPDMFFPPDLYQSVVGAVGEWPIEIRWMGYDSDASINSFLSALGNSLDRRLQLAKHLMCTRDWDCFMVVFQEMDYLQHRLWHLIDSEHVQYNAARAEFFLPLIKQLYVRMDAAIDELLSSTDDSLFVILMSDHGFGPLNYRIDLVDLLVNKGLLQLNAARGRMRVEEWFRRIDIFRLRRFVANEVRRKLGTNLHSNIDWSNTLAYPGTDTEQGVFVNLEGREPLGIVSPEEYDGVCTQVMDALGNATNPITGKPLFSRVCHRSEVHSGPYVGYAPDIVFELEPDGYALQRDYFRRREMVETTLFLKPAGIETGYHRPDGIFAIMGDSILAGKTLQARIVDLAPTVLYLLGCPIPSTMDGKILADVFKPGHVERNPPIYDAITGSDPPLATIEDVFSDQDAAAVEERLRSLGYL